MNIVLCANMHLTCYAVSTIHLKRTRSVSTAYVNPRTIVFRLIGRDNSHPLDSYHVFLEIPWNDMRRFSYHIVLCPLVFE